MTAKTLLSGGKIKDTIQPTAHCSGPQSMSPSQHVAWTQPTSARKTPRMIVILCCYYQSTVVIA
jgi:hypothetical protein